MVTEPVAYRDEDVELRGFFVHDDSRSDAQPGILLVHGGAGLDDHSKDQARRYADLGYVVFACDMYGGGVAGDRDRVMATITAMREDPQLTCRRAGAGLACSGHDRRPTVGPRPSVTASAAWWS
jgi:dienelactone hydrolase